jgi:hypothetical protein
MAVIQTLSDLPSNTSDHYPLSLTIRLHVEGARETGKQTKSSNLVSKGCKVNWEKIDLTKYQTRVEDVLRTKVYNKAFEEKKAIDNNLDEIITLMKTIALEAAPQKKAFRKKEIPTVRRSDTHLSIAGLHSGSGNLRVN